MVKYLDSNTCMVQTSIHAHDLKLKFDPHLMLALW